MSLSESSDSHLSQGSDSKSVKSSSDRIRNSNINASKFSSDEHSDENESIHSAYNDSEKSIVQQNSNQEEQDEAKIMYFAKRDKNYHKNISFGSSKESNLHCELNCQEKSSDPSSYDTLENIKL